MDSSPNLSHDLWLMICDLLDPTSVKRLAQTSSSLYAMCLPTLYSKVDLGVHHTKPYGEPHPRIGESESAVQPQFCLEPSYGNLRWPKDEVIFGRQNLFMETIFHKPELASLVRRFVWSMSLHATCQLPEWASLGPSKPNDNHKPAIYDLENTYNLFKRLQYVTSVDIFGGYTHAYPYHKLPSLFPLATSIELSGQMHFALASAILHGTDKSPLESLSMHYLHERGHGPDGENIAGQQRGSPFRTRPIRLGPDCCQRGGREDEVWDTDAPTRKLLPGTMIGLFNQALQSRCASLETLTLHTIGNPNHSPPEWRCRGPELQVELVAFLEVIQPEEVHLIYGELSRLSLGDVENRFRTHASPFPGRPTPTLPMLALPSFSGWPALRRLEIRGGAMDRYTPYELETFRLGLGQLDNVETAIDLAAWDTYEGLLRTWDSFLGDAFF